MENAKRVCSKQWFLWMCCPVLVASKRDSICVKKDPFHGKGRVSLQELHPRSYFRCIHDISRP